jgi:hypothetical protein
MKLGLTKETLSYGVPIFQTVLETAQGGFTLNESVLAAASEVRAGTVIGFDETTRLAKVAKFAVNKNASGTSDTTYEVYKGHNLAVGMTVKVSGGTGYAISTIDTSNANHDVITVATTLSASAVAAGAMIYVDDDGISKAKGLLYEDATVQAGETISVVLRGTVYENRIAPVSDALKTLLPNLIFSKSY